MQGLVSKLWILVALAALMMSGCEKEPCGCGDLGEQPVYFEYRFQNWAWGFNDQGWLIDGNGVVRGFNMPEGFMSADSTGMICKDCLEHNLSLCDTILDSIPRADLSYYTSLIPGASRGETGEAVNIAYDFGSSILSAYLYVEEKDMYRKVFLARSGDWEQYNLSTEAESLVSWLCSFGVFWLSPE